MDDFEYIAIIASYNALKDANIVEKKEYIENCGVFVSSGVGGIRTVQENAKSLFEKGNSRISPFFFPSTLINMCAGNIAIKFGLKGKNISHVSACASSVHSIGEAFNNIKYGKLDLCLAGGSEMSICELGVGGFDNMNALSSKYNDAPEKASRPLDKNRDGFVMGEGSVVLVLEELENAKKRNAKIYCEIVGYGASCDAYHITTPSPNGEGAKKSMENAIKDANIEAEKIDYINLHGTSTQAGDIAEINAIKDVFKEHSKKVSISSSKSITGHLLGASGALETMLCAKSIEQQILIPSANIEELDDCCKDMNIVFKKQQADINYVMTNSFGFGGTNGSLILKKYND